MAKRKAFLLRVDPALYDALQRWASDELRSVNGQIEYLLQRALRDAGRKLGEPKDEAEEPDGNENPKEGD